MFSVTAPAPSHPLPSVASAVRCPCGSGAAPLSGWEGGGAWQPVGEEIWLGKVQAQVFFTDALGSSVPLLPLNYWEKIEDSEFSPWPHRRALFSS